MKNKPIVKKLNVMERRLRVKVDCSKPVLTDQSWVKSQDVNNIMKKYQKTGVLPQTREHLAQYLDVSEIPSLEEAHDIAMEAKHMFGQLPSDVRRRMDNDPNQLYEFCNNPENHEYLVKRGVMDKIEPVKEVVQKVQIVQDAKSKEGSPSLKPENEPKGS